MITLYEGNETNFNHNGICVLNDCISAQTVRELNGKWELNITCRLSDKALKMTVGRLIKAPTPSGYQLFRIVKPVNNGTMVSVYCQHVFYDANQMYIDAYATSGTMVQVVQFLIDNALGNEFFTVSGDTSPSSYFETHRDMFLTHLVASSGSVAYTFGCEFDFNNYAIVVKNQIGVNNGVLIAYKKNLLGLTKTEDISNLATRLVPISRDGIGYSGVFVDSARIGNYPLAFVRVLNCNNIQIDENNDATDVNDQLYQAALTEFTNGCDLPQVSYKIDFIELSKTEEYKNFTSLQSVNIGDTVKVKDERIGVDISSRVVNYTYDCIQEKFKTVILGSLPKKIANIQNRTIKGWLDIPSKDGEEIRYINAANKLVTQALGNYQTQVGSDTIIHNASTISGSNNLLKLSSNGVVQKSTNGGASWTDVGNGNMAVQGDFTCNNLYIDTDMYMFNEIYQFGVKILDFVSSSEDVSALFIGGGDFPFIVISKNDIDGSSIILSEPIIVGNASDVVLKTSSIYNNLYIKGSCSAQSFIDRTPFYNDDALTELSKIKGTKDGEIDHETLPKFAQVELEDGHIERDIGNMVSIITKAIQQIIRKFKKVETKLSTSEKEVLVLSERISKIEMMLSATDESEDK